MEAIVTAEYLSAVFLCVSLLGLYNMHYSSESSKWLRISASLMVIYLLIDALSESEGINFPFILTYTVNLLSYTMGGVVLIFFIKYCESYIFEHTDRKPRIFWVPILLVLVFVVGTAVVYFCGKLVVYQNGVEVDCFDYPLWIRLVQLAGMLFTSAIAISKWKSIGVKAVILLGFFILAPAITSVVAMFTGMDSSVVCGAVALALVITILQHDRIQEQQVQIREAEEIAFMDALTGVKNDLAFTAVRTELNNAIKEHDPIEFALVFCDMNGLKNVNDTYGHEAGDIYIRNGCSILCGVYGSGQVYRIGGDEFVVVLRGADYLERQRSFEYLHQRIQEAEYLENIEAGKASLAAGMSEYDPETDSDVRDVQGRADAAMYKEKGSRRR